MSSYTRRLAVSTSSMTISPSKRSWSTCDLLSFSINIAPSSIINIMIHDHDYHHQKDHQHHHVREFPYELSGHGTCNNMTFFTRCHKSECFLRWGFAAFFVVIRVFIKRRGHDLSLGGDIVTNNPPKVGFNVYPNWLVSILCMFYIHSDSNSSSSAALASTVRCCCTTRASVATGGEVWIKPGGSDKSLQ